MDKLKMQSPNLVEANIDKIAALFPNCITESRDESGIVRRAVDFDLLRQEISPILVEGPQERYQLNWPGKREALLTANAPIAKTLRPCREESVDFENTKNIFIEGDNLDAMKLLQATYLNKIKMIYFDPPYNKGRDFIYKDNFTAAKAEHDLASFQIDEVGNRLVQNLESNGRFHSNWLCMMYSRLKLALNLLRDDGVIFISIDDNEVHNLRKICDEIFGADNFVSCLPTIMNLKGNPDAYGFSDTHEHTLVYVKNKNIYNFGVFDIDEEALSDWNEDEFGLFKKADTLKRTGQDASREKRPNGWFPVFITHTGEIYVTENNVPLNKDDSELWPVNEDGDELSWTWSKEKIKNESYNLIIVNGRNGKNIYKKQRPQLGDLPTKKPKSLFYKPEYSTSTATTLLKNLLGKKLFDGPKPVPLIYDFIKIGTEQNDILLDFFAGSATTAHATLQINSKDGGNRKFIMVQLPEPCDEKSEAYKAGYKTIAEIGKERIRRAGKKIKEEWEEKNRQGALGEGAQQALDIGFRVFKVDTSNLEYVERTPDALKQSDLELFKDHIKPDRTPEDLLFQVLIDWGLDLTLPISVETIDEKTVFIVDTNALVACFDKGITEEFVKKLAAYKSLRVVFRDDAFANDAVKINVEQIFRLLSPGTEVKSI